MIHFLLKDETCFSIFENCLESPLILFFIFRRENKIRKKTLNLTHDMKSKSIKIEYRFGDQVIYRKGTVGM